MRRGPKPGTPNAKRGGAATLATHGREHYAEIGQKGGTAFRDAHGTEGYQRIGRDGGQRTLERHGAEFFRRISREAAAARLRDELEQFSVRFQQALRSLGAHSRETAASTLQVQNAINADGSPPIPVRTIHRHLRRVPGLQTDGKRGRGGARWWLSGIG